MSSTMQADYEAESYSLIEEFLQRDLVSPETAQEAEELAANGAPNDALEIILADRRRGN